jgi:HSP20 family molecular chaperone IbpA
MHNIQIGNHGNGIQTWPGTTDPYDQPWIQPALPYKSQVWTTTAVLTSPWRYKINAESIDLWLDVPGVKAKDMSIDIDMGKLRVRGHRSDTQSKIAQIYALTDMYDPTTATATLEDGVLNVNVKKRIENLPRTVTIIVK